MKILSLKNSDQPNGIEITALLGMAEFEHLRGHLNQLFLVATSAITELSSTIKTGARHRHAKYFLFPARLRKQIKTTEFDFDHPTCTAEHYRDDVYIIFKVPKKDLFPDETRTTTKDNALRT